MSDEKHIVERTCTELSTDLVGETGPTRALREFRLVPAYVLLGDPGAGKSTEFARESEALGDSALLIRARDFVTFEVDTHPEWRDKVLFIDGLDEMRAGIADSRVPLDAIRKRLDQLGRPQFRISCREADWLGHNDRQSLMKVSPDSQIAALRLDPLSSDAIVELLSSWIHEHDATTVEAQAFVDEARLRGIDGLLDNPLTLRLLADAVKHGGEWPDSRKATFEMACRKMAAEENEEHLVGVPPQPTETILDAAGRLCALLLLGGFEGFSIAPRADTPAFPSLTAVENVGDRSSHATFRSALATRLFSGAFEGTLRPQHRQVAEFLGARYLAKRIDEGTPARRVVSLMVGSSDGRVVTVLRGLSAWLAAHSLEARARVIDADPVGVGLYGDIGDFTTEHKERLFHSLTGVASSTSVAGIAGYGYETAIAFRSLASPNLVPEIKRLLAGNGAEAPDDGVMVFVLTLLSVADESSVDSLAGLLPDLEAILNDPSRSSEAKRTALDAYAHIATPDDTRARKLNGLLDSICDGTIPDPEGELRGALLGHLYPAHVKPSEVWRYFPSNSRHDASGNSVEFWDYALLEMSSAQHVAELLDAFAEEAPRLNPVLSELGIAHLPMKLLKRGLEVFGETLELSRLYDWLDSPGRSSLVAGGSWQPSTFVREWLEARPDVQMELFLIWLRRCPPDDLDCHYPYRQCKALHGSELPRDFGLRCLDKAVELAEDEPSLAERLLKQAHAVLGQPLINEGLTLELMRERTRGDGILEPLFAELCERNVSPTSRELDERWRAEKAEWQQRMDQIDARNRQEKEQLRRDWAKQIRSHEDELRGNRFPPHNLDTLAQVALGLVTDVDEDAAPVDRISEFLGGDERLVEAVVVALRGAVRRDDVTDVDLTISLRSESKRSWMAYPVLASLELLHDADPSHLDGLDDLQKGKALAIHFCNPLGYNVRPPWYEWWLLRYPDLVLGVLYRCAVASARAGDEWTYLLDELDRIDDLEDLEDHDDLVNDIRLKLLKAFPVRGSTRQLLLLDHLLKRVFEHADQTELKALVDQKLASKSMTVAQRVRWLAIGALMSEDARLEQLGELKEYVSKNESRVRQLVEFLCRRPDVQPHRRAILTDGLDPVTSKVLIELLGCSFGPSRPAGWVTLDVSASELIYELIGHLGSVAGDEAGDALDGLIGDPRLEPWHEYLTYSRDNQRVISRDASYHHPSIQEIERTLANQAPANAGDLAALLLDRIDGFSDELRGANSNPWRQFWNEDPNGGITKSKPENSCRDALVTSLKPRFPPGVEFLPEGSYAAGTRGDIRVSYSNFNVPIEIKKNTSRDLWSALRTQLINQYATDPETSGYGIFLVLWFGKTITPHPDGNSPKTPEELKQRLEEDLTSDEKRKISVAVLDVTKPGDPH